MFTFASGGWVILVSLIGCMVLIAWAVAPAIMRGRAGRPPGDGRTIESFRFDLSNLAVDRALVVPAMLHRDMVPTMDAPTISGPDAAVPADQRWEAMQRRNDPKYGKYLVPGDLVIGVRIANEARCYPLSLLYVHEIINDVLAGVPIAVTYHWPCASAMVFDRRLPARDELQPQEMSDPDRNSRVAQFAVSGLVYNSNLLMYDRGQSRSGPESPVFGGGDETLWSQLLAQPIAGSDDVRSLRLTIIPCEVTTWIDWSTRHPNTTVINRDLRMYERYKDAAPTQYFRSQKLLFPIAAGEQDTAAALDPKTRVLAVISGEHRRVYPLPYVLAHGTPVADAPGLVEWRDTLGEQTLRFVGDPAAGTLRVVSDHGSNDTLAINAFWFAWHAMHPNDRLWQPTH